MTTKFNRILFDYDGTLIIHDADKQGVRIAEILDIDYELIPEFNNRLKVFFESPEVRKYYVGRKMTYELYYNIMEIVVGPLDKFGITAKQLDEAITEKSVNYARLAPNAIESLEYLKNKGYEICLFTNGFLKCQAGGMKKYGIYDYFERIYAWDGFYAKPDVRALRRALDGTEPIRNVMVGDDLISDIETAKKCGVYTIGINMRKVQGVKTRPDVIITDLADLKKIL